MGFIILHTLSDLQILLLNHFIPVTLKKNSINELCLKFNIYFKNVQIENCLPVLVKVEK